MGHSSGNICIEDITLEKVQVFYEWLQGKDRPDDICFQHSPHLSAGEAFSVIYYLQEELEIVPDSYEKCRECGELYDSYVEGTTINEDSAIDSEGNEEDGNFSKEMYGTYCDSCRPD